MNLQTGTYHITDKLELTLNGEVLGTASTKIEAEDMAYEHDIKTFSRVRRDVEMIASEAREAGLSEVEEMALSMLEEMKSCPELMPATAVEVAHMDDPGAFRRSQADAYERWITFRRDWYRRAHAFAQNYPEGWV